MTPSPPPNIGTRDAKNRAPTIAAILNRYDIAIINESFIYRDELLSHTEHPYLYTDKKVCYKPLNSGVLILSKIPLFNGNYRHYSKGSNWDWFTSKGLIGSSFTFCGEQFDLYGTHMQAGNSTADHASRLQQAKEIVEHVSNTHDKSRHLIICGDLNCGPTFDPEFKTYSGHYSNEADARLRNEQFNTIKNGTETQQLTLGPNDQDISSFLYKRKSEGQLRALRDAPPEGSDGLSDTGALCIVIS